MIDLSSVKTPGWQRVVSELHSPAVDDGAFLAKLAGVLAQVSGARQATIFAVERAEGDQAGLSEPRALGAWPPQPGAVQASAEAKSAARGAAEAGHVRLFGLERADSFYGEGERGSVAAVPVVLEDGNEARHVITLDLEPRSRQALQTTTAMIEVIAGYALLHTTRQQLSRTKSASAALDLAGRLIAAINAAPSFKGAAIQLVNDLTRQAKADRAAMGWVRNVGPSGVVRVVALSDTEHVDRRMAMVQKLEAAMDECLDQEQPVLYPPPSGAEADVLLAQAITHAHRELASSDARLSAVSLPLRDGDAVVGVVTIESASGPANLDEIELIQAALDLVAPVLVLRRSDDRLVATRAGIATLKGAKWLVGAKHTGWKLAGVALMTAAALATFVRLPFRVDAPMEVQPRTRWIIGAPFDGVIGAIDAGTMPGRSVSKGQVLFTMATEEQLLRAADFAARKVQAQTEADAAMNAGDKDSEAQQALARVAQAEAGLNLAKYNLDRAEVRSPIDGVIITGDPTDKLGASVKLGDPLFQVAPLDDMVIIARISDRDVSLLRGREVVGEIATKGAPAEAFPIAVEHVVPLAQAKDGKNTFEIRARLAPKDDAERKRALELLRPGMEGVAKFDVDRRSLLSIGTRRLRDQLQLWLWW
ncbi:MAG: efflux RND transporter periplasmic adaptor subunit [Phycisphaerales bacterium]